MLQIEECRILLCFVCPPIVELDGLLGAAACKERGQLSEDFVSVVGGGGRGTEFWVSLRGSGLFSIGDGAFFHGTFFIKSGFLSNNPPLGFAILKT